MAENERPDRMQGEDWAGEMGETWLANIDRFEGMIAPAGAALLAHAAFQHGERVVDIGCGGGATTIAIARAVAPGGEALGIDISASLVREAERRAERADVANARFVCADAATAQPAGAPFDRLTSRFGSMFFAEPAAAFANLRRMLRPGGRADLAVWASPSENQWFAAMLGVLGQHIELPAPVARAPGPFALADPDYARELLTGAGFTSVEFTLWRGDQLVGGPGSDPDSAAEFVLSAMSVSDALRQSPPDLRERVRADISALFAQHRASDGIRMKAAAWLITARA